MVKSSAQPDGKQPPLQDFPMSVTLPFYSAKTFINSYTYIHMTIERAEQILLTYDGLGVEKKKEALEAIRQSVR